MRKLILLLFAFFMVGIVYAINAERPSEKTIVIELFDFDSRTMVVSNMPLLAIVNCTSAESQNIGYYMLIENTQGPSGKLSDNTYLKKAGTVRICGLGSILYINYPREDGVYKYKEVRIRGVDKEKGIINTPV
jgi:hypothetical protein